MNQSLIKILLLLSIALIAYLVFQPTEKKQHSQQEMDNISKAFTNQYVTDKKQSSMQSPHPTTSSPTAAMTNNQSSTTSNQQQGASTTQQSIIGVIYKKPGVTWFFKAKDNSQRIDDISASFKNYFIDQLKFDGDEQPILTHIPESMKAANTSSMRLATNMIAGVEVSVSKLAGQQDVFANVQRWMRQIGLDSSAPVQIDFKDNNKTIWIKMPK